MAASISGASVAVRYLRESDPHNRRRMAAVVGQLAPSVAVGVVVTAAFCVARDGRLNSFLPAIWALLYGLGLFSSKPFFYREDDRLGGGLLRAVRVCAAPAGHGSGSGESVAVGSRSPVRRRPDPRRVGVVLEFGKDAS